MKAKIDIKFPSGKSAKGFPKEIHEPDAKDITFNTVITMVYYEAPMERLLLHKGNIITIEIL